MPSERNRLIEGMLAHYPFVLKNFRTYFRNIYRRKILRTNVVTPYSAIFYATHKCNLDCTYCTQKNPEVFSEELDTERTIEIFRRIRKDVDTLLITGGECLMRKDIEELVRAAKPVERVVVDVTRQVIPVRATRQVLHARGRRRGLPGRRPRAGD